MCVTPPAPCLDRRFSALQQPAAPVVSNVEPQTAGVVVRATQPHRRRSGPLLRPEHRPVVVMPIRIRHPGIKHQEACEHIEAGTVERKVASIWWQRIDVCQRRLDVLQRVAGMRPAARMMLVSLRPTVFQQDLPVLQLIGLGTQIGADQTPGSVQLGEFDPSAGDSK